MATLISMEMTKAEAKAEASPDSPDYKYPWGLEIYLDDASLSKLGINTLPTVGTEVRILAKAVIESVNENVTTDDGSKKGVNLQITDMAVEGMQGDLLASAAAVLYGKK